MGKIVVTGMGALSAAGKELRGFWETLYSGTTVYGPVKAFADDPNCRIKIGARIPYDIRDLLLEAGCPDEFSAGYPSGKPV